MLDGEMESITQRIRRQRGHWACQNIPAPACVIYPQRRSDCGVETGMGNWMENQTWREEGNVFKAGRSLGTLANAAHLLLASTAPQPSPGSLFLQRCESASPPRRLQLSTASSLPRETSVAIPAQLSSRYYLHRHFVYSHN
ncbi:unnamed protein product [Leuciscus chuanchicus]